MALSVDDWDLVRENFIFRIGGDSVDLRMAVEIYHDKGHATVTVFSHSFSTRIIPSAEGELDTDAGVNEIPLPLAIPSVVETEYGEQTLDRVSIDLDVVGLVVVPTGGNEYIPLSGWFKKQVPIETAITLIDYFPEEWLRYHSATYRKGAEERTVVDIKK